MEAYAKGEEPLSSAHDLRQSLEIGIAIRQSDAQGHKRIHLPLSDRDANLFPHPYRFLGGDVAGWTDIGYKGPPNVE